MKKLLLIFIALLFLCSCKQGVFLHRKYAKGFYHDRKGKPGEPTVLKYNLPSSSPAGGTKAEKSVITEPDKMEVLPLALEVLKKNNIAPVASVNRQFKTKQNFKVIKNKTKINFDCGDKIVLLDYSEIKCKILTVTESNITYRPCNPKDLALKTIQLNKIKYVKYMNGTVEKFELDINVTDRITVTKNGGKGTNGSMTGLNFNEQVAVCGYIASLITGIVFLAISPVAGAIISLLSILFLLLLVTKNDKSDKFLMGLLTVLGGIISWAIIAAAAAFIILILLIILTYK